MMELKSTVAQVIRHFVLSPVEPAHELLFSSEFVLKSDNGVPIRLQRR